MFVKVNAISTFQQYFRHIGGQLTYSNFIVTNAPSVILQMPLALTICHQNSLIGLGTPTFLTFAQVLSQQCHFKDSRIAAHLGSF